MTFADQLDAIDDLAETDLSGALTAASALVAQGDEQQAERCLLVGMLTARAGDLGRALELLGQAARLAERASRPVLAAEARITLASVHAAAGDYDAAMPLLRAQIDTLEGMPTADALLRDARAELAAYETLLGS